MTDFRIGNGIDVHRFGDEPSRNGTIVLGGVDIPHPVALLAHSDGDVLIHALIDAMLGALALGDIGSHFPDSDPAYKDVSSVSLLDQVHGRIQAQGWRLVNADVTVVAQAPKLAPFVAAIRSALAGTLTVEEDRISVKATTSEGLGFTGRGEGIAVFATVMLGRD